MARSKSRSVNQDEDSLGLVVQTDELVEAPIIPRHPERWIKDAKVGDTLSFDWCVRVPGAIVDPFWQRWSLRITDIDGISAICSHGPRDVDERSLRYAGTGTRVTEAARSSGSLYGIAKASWLEEKVRTRNSDGVKYRKVRPVAYERHTVPSPPSPRKRGRRGQRGRETRQRSLNGTKHQHQQKQKLRGHHRTGRRGQSRKNAAGITVATF